MFTLRKISGAGIEMNFYLGKSYTLVTREKNPNDFEESCKVLHYDRTEVYGFISDEDGHTYALFPKQQNYVMANGKTVDHIASEYNLDKS